MTLLSALLVASAAHAQTSTSSGGGQPPMGPGDAPAPTSPKTGPEPGAESAPPAPPQLAAEAKPTPAPSWYVRPTYEVLAGKWKTQIYGFTELDVINDSTRSWNESQGSGSIQSNANYAGQNGRTHFTARNSRFGFRVFAPPFEGLKTSANIEVDFMANPGSFATAGYPLTPSNLSEQSQYNVGAMRIRHAYLKIENDVVDILAGETYAPFAGQVYFFPCTVEYLPVPNQVLQRNAQLRLSKTIDTNASDKNSGVKLEIVAAALRPPQRDSSIPEGQALLRLGFKGWQGLHTPGAGGTGADPMAIAVSGSVRRFKVLGYQATPTDSSTETGWAVAVSALIPVIPVKDSYDRGNALTLIGEFTTGSGASESQGGMPGGLAPTLPLAPGAAPGTAAPLANVDANDVVYDPSGNGVLHTLDWQTYALNAQYYLPPSGRFSIAGSYTHGEAKNIVDLAGGVLNKAGMPNKAAAGVVKDSTYYSGSLFFDVTPNVRTGLMFSMTTQHRGNDEENRNMRWFLAGYYFF